MDLRLGLRLLARRPALSAGLILTLALGIAANASIFSVIATVLLHPLRFRDPGRLTVLWAQDRMHGDQQVERDGGGSVRQRAAGEAGQWGGSRPCLARRVSAMMPA